MLAFSKTQVSTLNKFLVSQGLVAVAITSTAKSLWVLKSRKTLKPIRVLTFYQLATMLLGSEVNTLKPVVCIGGSEGFRLTEYLIHHKHCLKSYPNGLQKLPQYRRKFKYKKDPQTGIWRRSIGMWNS